MNRDEINAQISKRIQENNAKLAGDALLNSKLTAVNIKTLLAKTYIDYIINGASISFDSQALNAGISIEQQLLKFGEYIPNSKTSIEFVKQELNVSAIYNNLTFENIIQNIIYLNTSLSTFVNKPDGKGDKIYAQLQMSAANLNPILQVPNNSTTLKGLLDTC